MIFVPSVKPEQLRGLETDFGSSISASIWRKIINNHAWVEKSIPIGMIMFFYEQITEADGDPKDPPNSDIWLFCDGSTISDSDSPLDGQKIPDLRNYFLKGSETYGLTGGQSTLNIQHNHGGQTGVVDDTQGFVADTGNDHDTGAPHSHSIDTRWSSAEPIIPKYFELQPYIRYK